MQACHRGFSPSMNIWYNKRKAPPRFELGISCLLDRRFNQLSHGASGGGKFAETKFTFHLTWCAFSGISWERRKQYMIVRNAIVTDVQLGGFNHVNTYHGIHGRLMSSRLDLRPEWYITWPGNILVIVDEYLKFAWKRDSCTTAPVVHRAAVLDP